MQLKLLTRIAAHSAVLFAFWLLLTDNLAEPELIAGGVAALLAGALATHLWRLSELHPRLRAEMLVRLYRPAVLLVTDTARVLRVLALAPGSGRRPHGRLVAAPYRATLDEPEQLARRILSAWAASVGSNRYVIGIDREQQMMLVHELTSAPGPVDPLELG